MLDSLVSTIIVMALMKMGQASIGSDLNCTTMESGEYVYSPSAVSCSNILSDDSCRLIFPSSSDFPAPGSKYHRPDNCYRNLHSPNAVQKRAIEFALSFCPKTCGFCCQTNEARLQLEMREVL